VPNGVLGNNDACGGTLEYANFPYIQSDGRPFPSGSPGPLGPPVCINSNTLFMAQGQGETCLWQLGGAKVPGTRNIFGGSSTTEYGPLLLLAYPAFNGAPTIRYNDFRRVLDNNPCLAHSDD
jgi:hypothetical protein